VRIGLVGIRGFGRSYLSALSGRDDAVVAAICDLDAAAAAALAAEHRVPHWFTDYGELLATPDLDAVFIATPHHLHHPMVMAALAAGKHVLCEKPLAIRAEHATAMAAAARAAGLTLTCHYNQRQTVYIKALKHLVDHGLLGDVYHVNARWMARWTRFMFDARTSWRLAMEQAGGGILIGRGSHLIDAIWWALGRPEVESIRADLHHHLTGAEVEDFAAATLRLAGGAVLQVQCSYVAHAAACGECLEYEAYGSAAGAWYRRADGGEPALRYGHCRLDDGGWEDHTAELDLDALAAAPPTSIIDDFLEAVAAGREPLVTGEDAACITRILCAGYESAKRGCEVACGSGAAGLEVS